MGEFDYIAVLDGSAGVDVGVNLPAGGSVAGEPVLRQFQGEAGGVDVGVFVGNLARAIAGAGFWGVNRERLTMLADAIVVVEQDAGGGEYVVEGAGGFAAGGGSGGDGSPHGRAGEVDGDGAGVGGVPEYVEGGEQRGQCFAQRAVGEGDAAGGVRHGVVQAEEGVRRGGAATAFEQVAGNGGGVFDDLAAALVQRARAGDGQLHALFHGLRGAQHGNRASAVVRAVEVLPAADGFAACGNTGDACDGVVGNQPFGALGRYADGGERDAPVHPRQRRIVQPDGQVGGAAQGERVGEQDHGQGSLRTRRDMWQAAAARGAAWAR